MHHSSNNKWKDISKIFENGIPIKDIFENISVNYYINKKELRKLKILNLKKKL